jgi:hypothetical protein
MTNLFLLAFYNVVSDEVSNYHIGSTIEYSFDMFIFLNYQYLSPVIYLVVFGFVKPDYSTIYYLNVAHYFLIFEVMKYVDFFIFYDWTILNIDYVCSLLLVVVILHLSFYIKKEATKPLST